MAPASLRGESVHQRELCAWKQHQRRKLTRPPDMRASLCCDNSRMCATAVLSLAFGRNEPCSSDVELGHTSLGVLSASQDHLHTRGSKFTRKKSGTVATSNGGEQLKRTKSHGLLSCQERCTRANLVNPHTHSTLNPASGRLEICTYRFSEEVDAHKRATIHRKLFPGKSIGLCLLYAYTT